MYAQKKRSKSDRIRLKTFYLLMILMRNVLCPIQQSGGNFCTYANNAWSQYFRGVDGYENVKVEEGYLKLRACKDNGTYKNGGVFSKIGFPCGTRLEVKARLTKLVRGGFPAIWQMPIGAPEWPRGGEIDLNEWVQGSPKQIFQTVHTFYINGENGSAGVTNKRP